MRRVRVLVAGLAMACGGQSVHGGSPTSRAAQPPDFELPTLNGGTVRLSDHLGKDVVLLDFWATFCEPCLASMPGLERLFRKHQSRGFVVLGISIDGPDSTALVRNEVRRLGVTFPILLDQETRVVSLYNPKTSAPYSVLIDRRGGIVQKREGYTIGDAASLESDVQAILSR